MTANTLKNIFVAACVTGIIGFDVYVAADYLKSREVESVEATSIPPVDDLLYGDDNELDQGTLAYDPVLAKATPHHKMLQMICDVSGVNEPELLDVSGVEIADSTPVVGVYVEGQSCAFVLRAMDQPSRHIVNTILDQTAVSMTYCPLVDCVRVVRKPSTPGDEVIPLRMGGLNEDGQMVLLHDGTRYDQESTTLPFKDVPFERLTYGAWKEKHPDTKVFCRESLRRLRARS